MEFPLAFGPGVSAVICFTCAGPGCWHVLISPEREAPYNVTMCQWKPVGTFRRTPAAFYVELSKAMMYVGSTA